MKLVVNRYGMRIVPEGNVDEAYIEEVLKLKTPDDRAICRRENAIGMSCIACILIEREPEAYDAGAADGAAKEAYDAGVADGAAEAKRALEARK